jgi:type VI secretion system secreted protein Hcp
MNTLSFYSVLLSGTILLGMKPAANRDRSGNANEIIGTMQVEGSKQGMIVGTPGTGTGHNEIDLISFKMGSAAPVDTRSGTVKGARTKHLIVVTKEIDPSSPKLYAALIGNESLKSVVIKLTTKTPDSRHKANTTVTLTDAVILKIRHDGPDLNPSHLEEISYAYRLILVQNADGSTSTTDDVNANDQ